MDLTIAYFCIDQREPQNLVLDSRAQEVSTHAQTLGPAHPVRCRICFTARGMPEKFLAYSGATQAPAIPIPVGEAPRKASASIRQGVPACGVPEQHSPRANI